MNAERRADLAVILRRQVLAAEYALIQEISEHGSESVQAVENAAYLAKLRGELKEMEGGSMDDLTHYMQATSRLRTQLAAASKACEAADDLAAYVERDAQAGKGAAYLAFRVRQALGWWRTEMGQGGPI